ncbi:MAX dimerization protein MGA a isoform X4 [Centropristis striata]|uniref:MAX dimerization protein MGA a isoform X4 n=1 Tax=Centropristis striata TaxID=184440 RepID=UPI0027DF18A1|nr:MAX dimerization protein MGA a isoform X4 [Centropristis striata]
MAAKKKPKGMVFHQEGATTPAVALAADHPPARFVLPKPGKTREGGMEPSTCVTNEEANMMGKPSKEPIRTSERLPVMKHPASLNPQSDTLSPESVSKGIKVTLDNNSMWNEFFRNKTEMILTKQGSRMFPYCRFRVSGLQPSRKYTLILDIVPLDNTRYKWTGKNWQAAGKAERHVQSQPFAHPESPSTGQHWMQNPVSFYKLKLTNNRSEPEGNTGNTILHPMHRYLPQLHVVQTDRAAKDAKLSGPSVVTFSFPQTEFMAVTAYQNSRFSQLKVDYNPFAKGLKEEGSVLSGLKLKLNSSKDGGASTNEQHPMKKSLKSLLANHKPRSSKAVDTKPSGSGDLQRSSTPNAGSSAAGIPGECSSSGSRPAQKLFSELIREAHVSLHRCNLEQLGISSSTSHTKNTAPKRDGASVKTQSETSPVGAKRTVEEEKSLLNSFNCKDNVRTDSSRVGNEVVSKKSSVDSDRQHQPEAPSDVKVKQQKRPAPLPLPALALFLKQHSTKSKMLKGKLDRPSSALPSEPLSGLLSFAAAPVGERAADLSKDLTDDVTDSDGRASGLADAHLHPDKTIETPYRPSSPSCSDAVATTDIKRLRTDVFLASNSVAESTGPEPSVLPDSDQSSCTTGTPKSPISSTLATSDTSPVSVLPASFSPQTPAVPKSPTLPSDSDSLLPDPECSSFGFESLSPASSPEPLPSLPLSLTLEFNSTTSEPSPKADRPEETPPSEDCVQSVFTWHTVLPPAEPFLDASFTTFQSAPQTLPLESFPSPLLPSQTPSHSEPQTLESASMPPPDPALPFTAELSPLALQLPLSPTFSSLDGDGLSPTPSLTDLVHFFTTNDDLGIGVEFPNAEVPAAPCPPPAETNAPSQQVRPLPANKSCRSKKKSRRRKFAQMDGDQKTETSTYTRMQPNLEEVEEQLFISFTSKEALKLHIADSDGTTEGHLRQNADAPETVQCSAEMAEGLEEQIAASGKILLKDLKLMRHRQVIHPVLQEVGLKMNLLDPTLAIDLQYLGVRLPVPPPGVSLEPLNKELPPPPGVSAAFVSRTGKTTDVTQIKGWREKFTPSEAPSTPTTPEAGPGSDVQKKNLSAFCSDMLDEYLENEGRLIDERAASFSQPLVEPLVYELPTRSTSYVRTLDSVLKKKTADSPTSDLISGFIPPSKRPKAPFRESKAARKESFRQKGPKHKKPRAEPTPGPAPALSPAEPNVVLKQPIVQLPATPPLSDHTAPVTHRSKKVRLNHTELLTLSPQRSKRRKLKPRTSSQTLSPPKCTASPPGASEDMAPLESDSELGTAENQNEETCGTHVGPVMTRALLRQKDLEDGVVWEGRPRTTITRERAAIALTSLFTLKGFVSENPTAPLQLVRRRAPPCLNEFCRLGCLCSSLARGSRSSHCSRPRCMFGCSCLKQKVVLLKNLDGSDSSPSQQGNHGKKKRRMKMAYVLKEADSVSQPAERVRILWRRDIADSDPEPTHAPESQPSERPERREDGSSCARVRAFAPKRKRRRKPSCRELTDASEPPETPKDVKSKDVKSKDVKSKSARLKSVKQRNLTLKDKQTKPSSPPPADLVRLPLPEPTPKPSKRLIVLAECKWASDRDLVLTRICEEMAQDRLTGPFWVKDYLISPISQTVEGSGADRCVQYKIHISRPRMEQEEPAESPQQETEQQQQDYVQQVVIKEEPVEEEEPLEDWQREVEEEPLEEQEEEPLEDWQREVEEDVKEEMGSEDEPLHDGTESSRQEMKKKKKKMVSMALPFLTGISPTGFLSANKRQPGGTDHLVQVNGKLYPLAKIQLGKMGALHPANRLAAYLTGRVGGNRKQQRSSSASDPAQSSGPTSTPTPQPAVVALPAPPAVKIDQSAADTPEGAGPRVVTVKVFPGVTGGGGHFRVVPAAAGSAHTDSLGPPKGTQLLVLQVPPPPRKLSVPPPRPATGQKMVLQPVQTASPVQFYRRPDGKLVQLVPISQLRPVNPNQPVQRGGAVGNRMPPPSAVKPFPLRSLSSPLSGLQSFSKSSPAAPLRPSSGFLPQKGTCTFRILPANSSQETLVVTCPKVPPKAAQTPASFRLLHQQPAATPVKLISLKPSVGRGVELGVKTVTVSPLPVGPGGMLVHQKPAISTPQRLPTPPPAMSVSEVPPVLPPDPQLEVELKPEPACGLVDQDVICVDDKPGLDDTARVGRTSLDGVELDESSSETENSSDFSDESDSEEEEEKREEDQEKIISNKRPNHSELEKLRRGKLQRLLDALRTEVGLSQEKTSKIATLKQAVQVIEHLKTTHSKLQQQKRRLRRRRDQFLTFICPAIESEQTDGPAPDGTGGGGVDMVDLLDSSDDERLVTKTTNVITVTNGEGEGHSVAVETPTEASWLTGGQLKLASMTTSGDSPNGPSVKKLLSVRSTDAFKDLRSVLDSENSPKIVLLHQAQQEIQTLKNDSVRLRSLKICLNQQRNAFITEIAQRSGQSEQSVCAELQQLLSTNQQPAGSEALSPAAGDSTDDDLITSSQAPPTPVSAPPTTTPVPTPVQTPVLQVSKLLAPPAVSHNAPVVRERPRTIPNILSRSKNPSVVAPPMKAVVPAEVVSLVGQQLVTLSPLVVGQTGLASVTLNIPNLTNQQIHLASLPCPPAGKIYGSSAPLAITDLTDLNNLLQLVHPSTRQPHQTQQQQKQQQTQPQKQQTQQQPPVTSDLCDVTAQEASSFPCAGLRAEVTAAGPPGVGHPGSRDDVGLTSLLNELVFLNQQTTTTASLESPERPCSEDAAEAGHAHGAWLLELDSDSDEAGGTKEEELLDHEEEQPGTADGISKAGALAPPPLLQMKVGGAKVSDAASSDGAAAEEGGGGWAERGMAWRPMPRLVPLGLRGLPPS